MRRHAWVKRVPFVSDGGRDEQVKEAGSQNEPVPDSPESAGTPERPRPSRLLVVSAALILGTSVSALALLSRADTSVRVPDLVGTAADPVGDNLVFTGDTLGLTVEVINVSDCRARDTDIVVAQTPAPGTTVSAGTSVNVRVCRNPETESAT
jgi:hypothetical protein